MALENRVSVDHSTTWPLVATCPLLVIIEPLPMPPAQAFRSKNQYPHRGNHGKADNIFVGVNNVQEYALVDLSANIIGCGKNNCQHNRVGRHQD